MAACRRCLKSQQKVAELDNMVQRLSEGELLNLLRRRQQLTEQAKLEEVSGSAESAHRSNSVRRHKSF